MKLHPLAVAVLALTFSAAHADALSPTEQKIVAEVKAHSAQGLELLERSVNINSGTMNHDGVRAVGKLFGEQFDQLGFKTRWSDMPAEMQRAGHLIATSRRQAGQAPAADRPSGYRV